MKPKKILLIGGNYFPEPTGIGKYNSEMIDWLANSGFSCTVVTTFPYYPYWKVQPPYEKSSFWFKKETRQATNKSLPINIFRTPHYVPVNPTGVKRIISDFSFFFSACLVILALLFKKRHDYVITVAPPFQIGLLALLYKTIKSSKFIYHIQDLQIDAARDLNMIKSGSILKILFSIEKFILNHADTVSTISIGMVKKVSAKCNKDIFIFPNWVDTTRFYPIANKAEIKRKFGFQATDKIVLYSGAIGEKQGLESILMAAEQLKSLKNIQFIICGSGPYKEKLQLLKKSLQLQNVTFLPLQPLNQFNEFLNLADVHLILQKGNASDLVMPSKLTAILSIGGVVIVTANEGTSLYEVIHKENAGILIEPENQLALTEAIKTATFTDNKSLERNARNYAEENLAIDRILSNFKDLLLSNMHSAPKRDSRLFEKVA